MNRHVGKKKGVINGLCSRCGNNCEHKTKRYCKKCSAAYMQEWRKTHPLSDEQRFKGIIRRKTNMRIKRGLLIKQPCEHCGDINVEAHHKDYSKPYDIMWLCLKCHRQLHKDMKVANG